MVARAGTRPRHRAPLRRSTLLAMTSEQSDFRNLLIGLVLVLVSEPIPRPDPIGPARRRRDAAGEPA